MATRPRSPLSRRAAAEPAPAPEQPEATPSPPEAEDAADAAGPERVAEPMTSGPMTSVEFDRLRRILRRKYH